jgi:hypothetical protein
MSRERRDGIGIGIDVGSRQEGSSRRRFRRGDHHLLSTTLSKRSYDMDIDKMFKVTHVLEAQSERDFQRRVDVPLWFTLLGALSAFVEQQEEVWRSSLSWYGLIIHLLSPLAFSTFAHSPCRPHSRGSQEVPTKRGRPRSTVRQRQRQATCHRAR